MPYHYIVVCEHDPEMDFMLEMESRRSLELGFRTFLFDSSKIYPRGEEISRDRRASALNPEKAGSVLKAVTEESKEIIPKESHAPQPVSHIFQSHRVSLILHGGTGGGTLGGRQLALLAAACFRAMLTSTVVEPLPSILKGQVSLLTCHGAAPWGMNSVYEHLTKSAWKMICAVPPSISPPQLVLRVNAYEDFMTTAYTGRRRNFPGISRTPLDWRTARESEAFAKSSRRFAQSSPDEVWSESDNEMERREPWFPVGGYPGLPDDMQNTPANIAAAAAAAHAPEISATTTAPTSPEMEIPIMVPPDAAPRTPEGNLRLDWLLARGWSTRAPLEAGTGEAVSMIEEMNRGSSAPQTVRLDSANMRNFMKKCAFCDFAASPRIPLVNPQGTRFARICTNCLSRR